MLIAYLPYVYWAPSIERVYVRIQTWQEKKSLIVSDNLIAQNQSQRKHLKYFMQ